MHAVFSTANRKHFFKISFTILSLVSLADFEPSRYVALSNKDHDTTILVLTLISLHEVEPKHRVVNKTVYRTLENGQHSLDDGGDQSPSAKHSFD